MEVFLLPLTGEEHDSKKNMRKKQQCCFKPALFLSNGSQEHNYADRKWHIGAQTKYNKL